MTKQTISAVALAAVIGGLMGYAHMQSVQLHQLDKTYREHEEPVIVETIELGQSVEQCTDNVAPAAGEDTAEEIAEQELAGELELLAQLCFAEAGNQGLNGMRLVCDVVLNRVDSEQFPDSIEEVIFQQSQFACIQDGNFDRAGWELSEDAFTAAYEEYYDRQDSTILYFTAGHYADYGTPAYQYKDHYFSTK